MKIHDGTASGQHAVGEVAGDAAENEAEGDLAGEGVRIEMMPREKQRDEREQADKGQRALLPLKRLQAAPVLPQWTNLKKPGMTIFSLVAGQCGAAPAIW
jgi:hypothetical protein